MAAASGVALPISGARDDAALLVQQEADAGRGQGEDGSAFRQAGEEVTRARWPDRSRTIA